MKFSAFNVDFSSPSLDPLGSRKPAGRRRTSKMATPLKSGYFIAIISCSVKTVADIGTYMLLIITSNSDKLFIGVNVDDHE